MTPLFRPAPSAAEGAAIRPRLGFLGVGRIGRQRMEALVQADAADVLAIADTSPEAGQAAQRAAPLAHLVRNIDELCAIGLDGIVIATPSGLHAAQATQALRKGVSVFCQKPLARTAAETRMVIDAARAADRLLAVDMSYRFTAAVQAVQTVIAEGHLGEVYAADLVFHNAYGPDKPWSRDPSLSGGGCLIDLGVHLVDLVRQFLPGAVTAVTSRLFSGGKRLARLDGQVEDYATLRLDVSSGATAFIACSWNVHAGCDAVIEARLYGTRGGASVRNVNGSFLDFVAEVHDGARSRRLCAPPDAWSGRAIVDWASRLGRSNNRYDPAIQSLLDVAEILDSAYGRSRMVA